MNRLELFLARRRYNFLKEMDDRGVITIDELEEMLWLAIRLSLN